jgi:phage baseplate assembly protein W
MAYNDLNTKFKETPNERVTTVDIETVKNGLLRFLQTPKGHDPFNRSYGSSLYSLLFKSALSPSEVQMFLYMDITEYEPRIDLFPSVITISKVDDYTYRVDCIVRVNGYSSPSLLSTTIAKE